LIDNLLHADKKCIGTVFGINPYIAKCIFTPLIMILLSSYTVHSKLIFTFLLCISTLLAFGLHDEHIISVDTLPSNCYAVSDQGNPDKLFIYDKTTDTWSNVGSTGVNGIEAVAFNPLTQLLYTFNQDIFGSINLGDGSFNAIGIALGNADGALGNIPISDIDGMTFDPYQNIFWASHRIAGGGNHDVVVQIDPVSGAFIPNAFGTNVDYIVMEEVFDTEIMQLVYDIDDIALDPQTNELYGIANQGGSGGMLVIYDKSNGTVKSIPGSFGGIDDMEALGFFSDGSLFGSTGSNGPDPNDNNNYYRLDKSNGNVIESFDIDPTGVETDFEACDCLSGAPNIIEGVVDLSSSCPCSDLSSWDDLVVFLYGDINGDGVLDPGVDQLLDTDTINNGDTFSFAIPASGNFIINLDSMSMPTNFNYVGATQHTAFFDGLDQSDTVNNFEFCANIDPWLESVSCDNNGTQNSGNDDFMTIVVNADNSAAGASNQFEVVYNVTVLNPGGTTYGSNVTVGAGQEFIADGTSVYTLIFRDVDNPLCETSIDIEALPGCSSCPSICLPITIVKTTN